MEQLNKIGLRLIKGLSVREDPRKVSCETCQDTQWIVDDRNYGTPCECRARAIITHRLGELMVEFARFRGADLRTIKPRNTEQGKAAKLIKTKPNLGYWLKGKSGAGKTYLLVAHYRECLIRGETFLWVGTEHRLKELAQERRAAVQSYQETKTMLPWEGKTQYRLFIDDLGKVGTEITYAADIYDIVDTFYRREWPVTLTTNLQEQELVDQYGGAFTRRLLEMCIRVELKP